MNGMKTRFIIRRVHKQFKVRYSGINLGNFIKNGLTLLWAILYFVASRQRRQDKSLSPEIAFLTRCINLHVTGKIQESTGSTDTSGTTGS